MSKDTYSQALYTVYCNDLSEVVTDEWSGQTRMKARCWKAIMKQHNLAHTVINHAHVPDMFLMSDLHFYHSNIIKYAARPYSDVNDMNSKMVSSIRNTVPKESPLVCLGDFGFSGKTKLNSIIDEIGREFDLIVGNHDIKRRTDHVIGFRTKSISAFKCLLEYEDYPNIIFTHYPLTEKNIPEGFVNVHGHTHDREDQSDLHFNVSWERCEYAPISMTTLLSKIKTRMTSMEV